MLGIGTGELIALAVLAMIVVGPEKLPRYAAEAARVLHRLRSAANSARADVRRELGPGFEDLSLRDLNPRNLVAKHLLDPIDLDSLDPFDSSGGPGRGREKPAARRGPGEQSPRPPGPAPFDPDTT